MALLKIFCKSLLGIVLIFSVGKSMAQSFNTDSALAAIAKMKDDTVKVQSLRKVGAKLEETDKEKSKRTYWDAIELSKKIASDAELSESLTGYGIWHINMGLYDTAEVILRSALEIANRGTNKINQANIITNIGNTFTYRTNYDSALSYYLIAIDMYEKEKNYKRAALLYINISSLYQQIHLFDKAKISAKKAVDISLQINDTSAIGKAYGNLANLQYTDSLWDESITTFKKALPFLKYSGALNFIQIVYNNIADAYYTKSGYLQSKKTGIDDVHIDYQQAEKYADSSIQIALKLARPLNLAGAYIINAKILTKLKKYSQAEEMFVHAFENVKKINDNKYYVNYYEGLADLHLAQRKYKEAYDDRYNKDLYYAKLVDENAQDKLQEMDAKYESQKKKSQIDQLEKDKEIQAITIKQKNTFNIFLVSGIIGLGLISFLFYRNTKRKQQIAVQQQLIQQKEIVQLQQEKQFIATNSILEGQEAERSRMAKDLHDGVGGMLSGIKLNLSSMKGNMIIQEKDALLFNKTISQLDNAISEMRRVAHNMMPEALIKFGLSEAIQDYCDGINESHTVTMKFTAIGQGELLEKSTEVILYRIVQELSNNALKHAEAKNIFIQFSQHSKGLSLVVEDDGVGFDTDQITKGAGLQNVQSRVDYLKGNWDIKSEIGSGTSVNIEIPL